MAKLLFVGFCFAVGGGVCFILWFEVSEITGRWTAAPHSGYFLACNCLCAMPWDKTWLHIGVFDVEQCAEIVVESCGGSQTWFYPVHTDPLGLAPAMYSFRYCLKNHELAQATDLSGTMLMSWIAAQGSNWCSGPVLLTINILALGPEGYRAKRWAEEEDVDEKYSNGFHWCQLTEKEH